MPRAEGAQEPGSRYRDPTEPGGAPGDDPLDGTTWVVERGPDLPPSAEVVLAFTAGILTGNAGVNLVRAPYEAGGGRCRLIGPAVTTMRAGPPELMALEQDVLRRLGAVAACHLEGDALELRDEGGELLLGLRAVDADGLRGTWEVVAVHRPERSAVVSVAHAAVLVFEDEVVHGNAGCNQLRGGWSAEASTIAIGPLMVTRKQCEDDLMAQEQAVLQALETAIGYRLTPTVLHLLRPDGGVAVTLRRVDG